MPTGETVWKYFALVLGFSCCDVLTGETVWKYVALVLGFTCCDMLTGETGLNISQRSQRQIFRFPNKFLSPLGNKILRETPYSNIFAPAPLQ